jgi:hypothetical protein
LVFSREKGVNCTIPSDEFGELKLGYHIASQIIIDPYDKDGFSH